MSGLGAASYLRRHGVAALLLLLHVLLVHHVLLLLRSEAGVWRGHAVVAGHGRLRVRRRHRSVSLANVLLIRRRGLALTHPVLVFGGRLGRVKTRLYDSVS